MIPDVTSLRRQAMGGATVRENSVILMSPIEKWNTAGQGEVAFPDACHTRGIPSTSSARTSV